MCRTHAIAAPETNSKAASFPFSIVFKGSKGGENFRKSVTGAVQRGLEALLRGRCARGFSVAAGPKHSFRPCLHPSYLRRGFEAVSPGLEAAMPAAPIPLGMAPTPGPFGTLAPDKYELFNDQAVGKWFLRAATTGIAEEPACLRAGSCHGVFETGSLGSYERAPGPF